MEERRKSRRMGLECTLMVKRIDNGEDGEITIDIQDVSKSGIGFLCKEKLELDAIYESYITIWTKEVIHTLIKVARVEDYEDGNLYGAIFMALSDIDAFRISVYDTMEQEICKQKEHQMEE